MNDAERAQVLKKLLARVRANAEARPPPGSAAFGSGEVLLERPIVVEAADELRAWPAAGERTSFPDQPEMTEDEGDAIAMRIDRVRPIRRSSRPPRGVEPPFERGVRSRLMADRWSVLLQEDAEGPLATFSSEVPPPPANPTIEEKWRDREPEGALERAVREAAHARASQRGAIWIDLVAELKARPSTHRPLAQGPDEEPGVEGSPSAEGSSSAVDPPADAEAQTSLPTQTTEPPGEAFASPQDPVFDEASDPALPLSTRPSTPPSARSSSPAPYGREERLRSDTLRPASAPWSAHPSVPDLRRSAPPSSLLPASRRLRRRAQRWSYAKRLVTPRSGRFPAAAKAIAFVAAVGIVAVVIAVAWFRNPPSPQPAPTTRIETASQPQPPITTQPSLAPTHAIESATAGAPSAATPSDTSGVGVGDVEDAPADTAQLPEKSGYLFVASPNKILVYLDGIMAGDARHWLRVGCGWHYLRLARRGSPPVGSSFPVWATEGRSVLVPCRGATRVELTEDD